jgi:hypothetical protein
MTKLSNNIGKPKDLSELRDGATVLIHIGKCGGRTLKDGLDNAVRNADVRVVHINKPVFRSDLKYIVVARGPISRVQSAFRWRYKLVVTSGKQRNRFDGEYDVLVKYATLNSLAEALYNEDGTANVTAHQEMRAIHHIKEDIAFYLDELLGKCSPSQITGVLMQENLDDDILRVFGYRNALRKHINPASKEHEALSDSGLRNLKMFLTKDYGALVKLFCWGKIQREVLIKAI